MNWKKILLTLGLGGLVVATVKGASYANKLNRVNAELETLTRTSVHKFSLFSGITLRVDAELKNPGAVGLRIKFPFVKAIYQNATIGSSNVVDKDVNIPAYGQVKLDPIMIEVPSQALFALGLDILKSLDSGKAVALTIRTISTVFLPGYDYPYTKDEPITIKLKK